MKKIISSFLSSIYHAGLLLCQGSYRALPFRIKKVNARVVSIGNITWGGTGKTPLTIKLALDLSSYGKKVAVLTRGYGKDEVEELRSKLPNIPVLVGRDRVRTAREAVQKYGAEILILDDGFQHLRLHRDLDVITLNSTLPFGPGGLLPSGTLREPLQHLSRAQVFILTKSNIGSKNLHWIRQKLMAVKPDAVIFEAVHKPLRLMNFIQNRVIALTEIKGRKVAALSGIGDPYSFEKTVENLGSQILFAARYDDHHTYTRQELLNFVKRCKEIGVTDAVTTEKDFIRIAPFLKKNAGILLDHFNFLVLQIEFQMSDEEDFLRRCANP